MASSLFSTKAIVLSWRDWREVDRRYAAMTPDLGKIEFMARGGHKPLAKLTPALEMPAEVELLLVRGRNYLTVAGVERQRVFAGSIADLSSMTLMRAGLQLADLGTREMQDDPDLYPLLMAWLEFLHDAPELSAPRAGFVLGGFSLRLLSILGFRPQLGACLSCREAIAPGGYRWSALKGGVVCSGCANDEPEQWFTAHEISDDALKLLRFALEGAFADLLRPVLPGEALMGFHEAVESLIVSHFPVIPGASLREAVQPCAVCV